MYLRRFVYLSVFCLLFFTVSFAQTSPTESQSDKEKKQKELEKRVLQILDDAVSEAANLRLAQNRAIVYAIAGDLYWKFDEKRARDFFRSAGNDITVANAESEQAKKDSDDPYFQVYDFNDIRYEILPMIAKHDADLGLELLTQTRPAKLAEALAKATQPNSKQSDSYLDFNPDQYRVRQEIALEQRFAVLAAEQNPDKAIKLIKESLAKGISWNVLSLLQKINQKDEKKAASLADDVVKKIVDTDLIKKTGDLGETIRLLQFATNPNAPKTTKEKQFKFSDQQLRDVADKLVNTFLQPSNSMAITIALMQVIKDLDKIVPEKTALLKQKQAESMKNMPSELKRVQQQEKLWNQNSTPEEILAEISKLENEYEKTSAYQSLNNKIAQIEDEDRAKKLIEQIPDEKARANATEQYESMKISRTAKDGKLDDAKKMIANLTKKKTQIQKLVALAMEFQKKNTEKDHETAVGLMKDAKALTNEYPEDEDELNDLMEIVKGFALVNPDEAFRIFDPIVDQINDYVQATAILSKYNKRSRNFIKGELVLKSSGYSFDILLFRYINQMQMLGKADLEKMNSLTNKFTRSDARIIAKLFVAQGFLAEDKKSDNNEGSGGMIISFGD